jgi:hypothetical protein
MINVHLRWIFSNDEGFPFRYTVFEKTTIKEICQMVLNQNNTLNINPTFSVVKIYGKDMFLDDSKCIEEFNDNNKNVLTFNFAAG